MRKPLCAIRRADGTPCRLQHQEPTSDEVGMRKSDAHPMRSTRETFVQGWVYTVTLREK
jgi:hypothetical protein